MTLKPFPTNCVDATGSLARRHVSNFGDVDKNLSKLNGEGVTNAEA